MAAEDRERRNAIPILYTSGTYYEVGLDVGRTFRGLIQDYLGPSTWLHEILLPAYETEAGRATYDETLAGLKENYPQYVRELQGTADGAQVPFHHLMLLNMEKIMTAEGQVKEKACLSSLNGCSDLSINMKDQVLLGHTEDTYRDMMNLLYIVSATIVEEEPQGKLGTQRESFTALCYPGHLPGYSLGYNRHGLVFSINVIVPLKVLPAKTPRMFLCRALLSATSVEAAHNIVRDRGTGAADGFSINMVFVKEKGTHDFQIVEVGPPQGGNESELSIVPVEMGQHFFHANKYLHLTNVPEENSLNITSSDRRAARASQFPAPKNLEDMLEILSDKKDPSFPIFRDGSVEGFSRTLSLGVFDVVKKTWTTWMRNPKEAAPLMQIPLHFNWDT